MGGQCHSCVFVNHRQTHHRVDMTLNIWCSHSSHTFLQMFEDKWRIFDLAFKAKYWSFDFCSCRKENCLHLEVYSFNISSFFMFFVSPKSKSSASINENQVSWGWFKQNWLFFFFIGSLFFTFNAPLRLEIVLAAVGASLILTYDYQIQPKEMTDLWNNTSPTP